MGWLLCLPLLVCAKPAGYVAIWQQGAAQIGEWQAGSNTLRWQRQALPSVSLGSTWKLFVYAYLVDNQVSSPAYFCQGKQKEEVYCCTAGQSIDREAALIHSCGLFFDPQRLGITALAWQRYWQRLSAPAWIEKLSHLNEKQTVAVGDLLRALAVLPISTRQRVASALIAVTSAGSGSRAFPVVGSQLRVKTWSMPAPEDTHRRIGGGLGWLADGTPIWLQGPGTGNEALSVMAPALVPMMRAHPPSADNDCVMVRYFARYPIRRIEALPGATAAKTGLLNGRYRVFFRRGSQLDLITHGEMQLSATPEPILMARLSVNEYVARVLDREADTEPVEAAKALAIVIRSYLLQNAVRQQGCYHIEDSTRYQRVSPNPATPKARQIALWSDELVVTGAAVRYHLTDSSSGVFSWKAAIQKAANGKMATSLLSDIWPAAIIQSYRAPGQAGCDRIPLAEKWLSRQLIKWQPALRREAGFEALTTTPVVCRSLVGNPNAESGSAQIFIKSFVSEEDRIALTHEYLHLVFANHPRGLDEYYIENQARRLQRDAGYE